MRWRSRHLIQDGLSKTCVIQMGLWVRCSWLQCKSSMFFDPTNWFGNSHCSADFQCFCHCCVWLCHFQFRVTKCSSIEQGRRTSFFPCKLLFALQWHKSVALVAPPTFSLSLVLCACPSKAIRFMLMFFFGLMFLTFFSNDCHNCAHCWRCEEAQKTPPMLWCVKMFFTQATILVFKHSFVHVAHWMPIQKSHCTHSIVLDCCGSILTEQIQIKVSFCHINHMKKLILQLSLLNCSSSPLWAEQEADVAFPKR